MDEKAIFSAVDSLQRIFTVVLALALGEALKQFVADKAENPKDRIIHWDRLVALLAFLLLLIPFYEGMARYLYAEFQTPKRATHYSGFLLMDSIAFTIEASLFFVMSRALPMVQWRRFYAAVLVILGVDTAWEVILLVTNRPASLSWLSLNLAFAAVLAVILIKCADKRGPYLAAIAMLLRTIFDYVTNWGFYFPS